MRVSPLEVLRPFRTIVAGKASASTSPVVLYAIVAVVAGARFYRQMHEFIRIHRQRLDEAVSPEPPCSPKTGSRSASSKL